VDQFSFPPALVREAAAAKLLDQELIEIQAPTSHGSPAYDEDHVATWLHPLSNLSADYLQINQEACNPPIPRCCSAAAPDSFREWAIDDRTSRACPPTEALRIDRSTSRRSQPQASNPGHNTQADARNPSVLDG
jgi:hypothetical protein